MTTRDGRGSTERGRLVRLGFVDADQASDCIATLSARGFFGAEDRFDDAWLEALGQVANPDQALLSLMAIVLALPDDQTQELGAQVDTTMVQRLVAVLGASRALGDFLSRHPAQIDALGAASLQFTMDQRRSTLLEAVGADPMVVGPVTTLPVRAANHALRIEYKRQLLQIAAADVADHAPMPWVGEQLADLASAALETALAIARSEVDDSHLCRLTIMGMGKTGGRELNYISDVDVIFVAEPEDGATEEQALRIGTALATAVIRNCGEANAEGSLWEVDAALRPEGKSGALVRTLASHTAYYQRWASTWEFQALLKSRWVAGDRPLAVEYLNNMAPMVWAAASRPDFVSNARAMRRRVEETIPAAQVERQLKLGPGGLRDVEFSVQLLQLVHGRDDFRLRSSTTLSALEALSTYGFVGRDDAAELDRAYQFLRTLEHRIQLVDLRRTHIVPEAVDELRAIGRSMGFVTDPAKELVTAWRGHQREVRRLHEKLFYRPLLDAVARLEPGSARLTLEAAQARLVALGFADPAGALRQIEALTSGISRRATVQKALLPVMLSWFADSPDPDAGLLAFRQVSDALGSTPWYLRLLRDEGAAAERMARVLGSSVYASDLLLRAPDATVMFGDDDELAPAEPDVLLSEATAIVARQQDSNAAIVAIRGLRRRELLRTSIGDVLGQLSVNQVCTAVSTVADVVVEASLQAAIREIETRTGAALPTRIAVIGMGRFGGRELGYGSDADVMFVHDPLPGVDEEVAGRVALDVANELTRLLAAPAPDPPLLIDANLRPEGKQGPLVRSLASYASYYARWSLVWESQALLRAAPVAGDRELGEQFVTLINPMRYPEEGLSIEDEREIRRIKARVETERLPRGTDPKLHLKLGPGGLADVEWTVQLLQLKHGFAVEGLRTTSTLEALDAAADEGLITREDANVLSLAWRRATHLRNVVMLTKGKAADALPTLATDQAKLAQLLTRGESTGGEVIEGYLRVTRRARAVVERVFYG